MILFVSRRNCDPSAATDVFNKLFGPDWLCGGLKHLNLADPGKRRGCYAITVVINSLTEGDIPPCLKFIYAIKIEVEYDVTFWVFIMIRALELYQDGSLLPIGLPSQFKWAGEHIQRDQKVTNSNNIKLDGVDLTRAP